MQPKVDSFRDCRNLLTYVFEKKLPGAPKPTPMQYDICDTMQRVAWPVVFGYAHPQPIDTDRIIIEALRGVGKSVIAQVVAPWAFYWNPNLKILSLSASEGFAKKFSTTVLSYIRTLEPLKWLAPGEGCRDSVLIFDVSGCEISPHPSMQALGIGGHITGCHADLLFIDDVETDENSRTDAERQKGLERMNELAVVRKPLSATIVPCTPHSEESMYNVLARSRGYRRFIWPAQYPDPEWMANNGAELAPMLAEHIAANPSLVGPSMRENDATEPIRFPLRVLADQELQMGRSAYDMQMNLNTALSDANKYPLKLSDFMVADFGTESAPLGLRWSNAPEDKFTGIQSIGIGKDHLYRAVVTGQATGKFEGSVMSIDPAGMGGDAMGVCVTRYMGGMVFVAYIGGIYGGFGDPNLIKICEIAKKYGVQKIIPEPNFGDGMFTNLLIAVAKVHYPECGIEDTPRSVAQKERRIIATLEPVLNAHRVVVSAQALIDEMAPIPGVGRDSGNSYRFQHQLTRLTKDQDSLKHDDLVDALALSVAYWSAFMAITPEQAQETTKARNIEADIQAWYRTHPDSAPQTHRYGHSAATTGFIKRQRRVLNDR